MQTGEIPVNGTEGVCVQSPINASTYLYIYMYVHAHRSIYTVYTYIVPLNRCGEQ